ncbi:MAG: cation transporter [Chloroflexi bacterium]|nr:cation transporter [Chloroflexota bacterium]
MSEEKQITLPVMGMTCANCVATVERNAKKVDGVAAANVNFASEKVTFTYDPALVKPQPSPPTSSPASNRLATKCPPPKLNSPCWA